MIADSGYGHVAEFRKGVADRGLSYVVAVQKNVTVFDRSPRFAKNNDGSRSKTTLAKNSPKPKAVEKVAKAVPSADWQKIVWRKGTKSRLQAEFVALRVLPSQRLRGCKQHDECWLLCERSIAQPDSWVHQVPTS